MCSRIAWLAAAIFFILPLPMAAQGTFAATPAVKPQIQNAPAPYSDPTSGKAMYMAYCASCHGTNAQGDGPAAPALKTTPADLTILAARNMGIFPGAHIAVVIRGDEFMPAHGGKGMPVWGPVFLTMGRHESAQVQLRIRNLTAYLESIQKK